MNGLDKSDITFLFRMFLVVYIGLGVITSIWSLKLLANQAEILTNQHQIIQLLK